jgi:hypothetical protein
MHIQELKKKRMETNAWCFQNVVKDAAKWQGVKYGIAVLEKACLFTVLMAHLTL